MRDGIPLTGAVSAADWDWEIEKSPAQKKRTIFMVLFLMCGRRESNPYASRHQILSLACLPISTRPQTFYVISFRKRNANILLIFETASMNLRHADSSLPLYEYYSHQRQSYDCHSRADRKINSEIHMSSDQICYKQEARSHCWGYQIMFPDVCTFADYAAEIRYSEGDESNRAAYRNCTGDKKHYSQ